MKGNKTKYRITRRNFGTTEVTPMNPGQTPGTYIVETKDHLVMEIPIAWLTPARKAKKKPLQELTPMQLHALETEKTN